MSNYKQYYIPSLDTLDGRYTKLETYNELHDIVVDHETLIGNNQANISSLTTRVSALENASASDGYFRVTDSTKTLNITAGLPWLNNNFQSVGTALAYDGLKISGYGRNLADDSFWIRSITNGDTAESGTIYEIAAGDDGTSQDFNIHFRAYDTSNNITTDIAVPKMQGTGYKLVTSNYSNLNFQFRINHNTSGTWIPVFTDDGTNMYLDYVTKSEIIASSLTASMVRTAVGSASLTNVGLLTNFKEIGNATFSGTTNSAWTKIATYDNTYIERKNNGTMFITISGLETSEEGQILVTSSSVWPSTSLSRDIYPSYNSYIVAYASGDRGYWGKSVLSVSFMVPQDSTYYVYVSQVSNIRARIWRQYSN